MRATADNRHIGVTGMPSGRSLFARSRQVGAFVALHLPDIAKTPDQLLNNTAADTETKVAKAVLKFPCTGIFIANIETAQ